MLQQLKTSVFHLYFIQLFFLIILCINYFINFCPICISSNFTSFLSHFSNILSITFMPFSRNLHLCKSHMILYLLFLINWYQVTLHASFFLRFYLIPIFYIVKYVVSYLRKLFYTFVLTHLSAIRMLCHLVQRLFLSS